MTTRVKSSSTASSITTHLANWVRANVCKSHDRTRVHVVSPGLCNDVLKRLAPSLPKPNACDVIDLSPGVCLWSSKIHDLLKPRRHVLVERERDLYHPFLEPLLTNAGSTYRHASSLADVFDRAKGLLDVDAVEEVAPHLRSINTSLLIIANLTYRPSQRRTKIQITAAKQMLHSYYNQMFSSAESMHKYGLVRMLAFLPDEEKSSFLPRTVAARTKQSVQMDLASSVSEVAGGTSYQDSALRWRRPYDLDIRSQQRVAQRFAKSSLEPAQRPNPQLFRSPESLGLDASALAEMSTSPHKPTWVEELVRLEGLYQREQLGDKPDKGATLNEDREQLRKLRNRRVALHNRYKKNIDLVHRQKLLDEERKSLMEDMFPPAHLAARIKTLQSSSAVLQKEIRELPKDNAASVKKYIDDQRAFDHVPSVLAWDRRDAEPLVVEAVEFYPQRTLALIDLQPKSNLLSKLDTSDKQMCVDHFLTMLLQHSSKTLREALETIVQGGLDEFIDRVPGLRDSRGGGLMDLDDVRVRSLPSDLIFDLALAWESWPFRSEITTIQLRMGQSGNDLFADG